MVITHPLRASATVGRSTFGLIAAPPAATGQPVRRPRHRREVNKHRSLAESLTYYLLRAQLWWENRTPIQRLQLATVRDAVLSHYGCTWPML